MRRREFIALGGLAASAWPLITQAQPLPKSYRIGHLSTAGRTMDGAPPRPLRDGLRDLGYIEGQNARMKHALPRKS